MSAIPRALPTCCGAVPPFRPGPALQCWQSSKNASSSRMQSMNMRYENTWVCLKMDPDIAILVVANDDTPSDFGVFP